MHEIDLPLKFVLKLQLLFNFYLQDEEKYLRAYIAIMPFDPKLDSHLKKSGFFAVNGEHVRIF